MLEEHNVVRELNQHPVAEAQSEQKENVIRPEHCNLLRAHVFVKLSQPLNHHYLAHTLRKINEHRRNQMRYHPRHQNHRVYNQMLDR